MALVSHHLAPGQETACASASRSRWSSRSCWRPSAAGCGGGARPRGSDLEQAAALAPADAERLSWTDWAGVRRELGADLSDSSSAAELSRFLDRGFDADLTSTSALLASAPVLQTRFGFSPATVDWELFSQSAEGAVVILRLPDATDFATLEANLTDLGYAPPESDTACGAAATSSPRPGPT